MAYCETSGQNRTAARNREKTAGANAPPGGGGLKPAPDVTREHGKAERMARTVTQRARSMGGDIVRWRSRDTVPPMKR